MTTSKQPTASLYVGNLDPSVTEDILHEAFAEFKTLTSVSLCKDASGRSLGYGYANFLSREDANLAISEKNDSLLETKVMQVTWPEARRSGVRNVFIENLPESVNKARLKEKFIKFGEIVTCEVATFAYGKSRGYGFVQFEQEDAAHAAIEKLNGTIFDKKEIYVGESLKKTDRASHEVKLTNLYIKNLNADVSDDLLREKFSVFGKISSLAIAKAGTGACIGFAFVSFDNPEDARRAAETMNGTQFGLTGSKILSVGLTHAKAELEAQYREEFQKKCKEHKPSKQEDDKVQISSFLKGYEPSSNPTDSDIKLIRDVSQLEKLTSNSCWKIYFPRATDASVFNLEFTPYRVDGSWVFTVEVSENYPLTVPRVRCLRRVDGHRPCSIDEDGVVLLEERVFIEQDMAVQFDQTAKSDLAKWNSAMTLTDLVSKLYRHFMSTADDDLSEGERDVHV